MHARRLVASPQVIGELRDCCAKHKRFHRPDHYRPRPDREVAQVLLALSIISTAAAVIGALAVMLAWYPATASTRLGASTAAAVWAAAWGIT